MHGRRFSPAGLAVALADGAAARRQTAAELMIMAISTTSWTLSRPPSTQGSAALCAYVWLSSLAHAERTCSTSSVVGTHCLVACPIEGA